MCVDLVFAQQLCGHVFTEVLPLDARVSDSLSCSILGNSLHRAHGCAACNYSNILAFPIVGLRLSILEHCASSAAVDNLAGILVLITDASDGRSTFFGGGMGRCSW